jgi:hypothetical protein
MKKYKLTTQELTTHDDFKWEVGVKVTTSGIGYKGFNMFLEDTLYDKFEEVKDAD